MDRGDPEACRDGGGGVAGAAGAFCLTVGASSEAGDWLLEDDVMLVKREVPAPSDAETAGAAGDTVLDTS